MYSSPDKLTKEEKKEQLLKVQAENNRTHSLVVKIISWRTGIHDGALIQDSDKITPDEWQRYRKHLLEISKAESVEVVKNKLDEMYAVIESNGGFEK